MRLQKYKKIGLALLAIISLNSHFAWATTQSSTPLSTENIDAINQKGVLKVGLSTFVPWAMRNKQGQLIGFEVDVANRLAKDHGWQAEFVPTAWDGIIPALLAKKFDVIIGGISITPERSKSVLFSLPYSHSGVQIAANKSLDKKISKIADLNSRRIKIAARRGAHTVQVARETFPKAQILQFDDETQALQEVLNGNAELFIASSPKPEHESLKHPDKLFIPFTNTLAKGNEGFAVRLGEQDKKQLFDKWINERQADGWLEERYQYWFSTLDWESSVAKAP